MPTKSGAYRKHSWLLQGLAGLLILIAAAGANPLSAQTVITRTSALSLYDSPKYRPGFRHFDYVNPSAPKGGKITLPALGSFDTLNPYLLKGVSAMESIAIYGISEMNEPLMIGTSWYQKSGDEPQSAYCLICSELEFPDDFTWVIFHINPQARFHNGEQITAHDVARSFELLQSDAANPLYKNLYGNVRAAEVLDSRRVKFQFRQPDNRSLILRLGELPVMSKKHWDTHDFGNSSGTRQPLSGPYRIKDFKLGNYLVLERVADFWAKDHPLYRGQHNFNEVKFEFFRDRTVAFEAFKSGRLDFWIEYVAKNWAYAYDFPAVNSGLVVKRAIPHQIPSGTQAFFINNRRDKFKDVRTRKAISILFDFAWINRNIFAGAYRRSQTHYPNSVMGAQGVPGEAELKLLEPWRSRLPAELFEKPFSFPEYDGSGNVRSGLKQAFALLKEAGWEFRQKKLVNSSTGQPFSLELMIDSPSFQRVLLPFVKNLQKVGIDANIRIVDSTQLKARLDVFDFDMAVYVLPQTATPGQEQRLYFHSSQARVKGSRNLSGIEDPVVDAMLDRIGQAGSLHELITASRALDRVLLWNYYTIPQWYLDYHRIAYWNHFGQPEQPARLNLAFQTWWKQ